ncbi:hypothetical protein BD626DRAFT_473559 [Schizophyllum amplum]|uniref:MYND-type domain-containing protein n=1 Tax=Schizophyllum amplum TaxID=97359 RepID=A0A550CWY0_9AGAR|nr:hypothetical protein BD626DRAFT_473559 [Auriculariopsis ampla]
MDRFLSAEGIAEVMSFVASTPPAPEDVTDEHRGVIINGQILIFRTMPQRAQMIIHCEYAAKYLPQTIQRWRNNSSVMSVAPLILSEIQWCPYFLHAMFRACNQDLAAMQVKRTLDAAEAIEGMKQDELDRILEFLATLLLVQDRKDIPESDLSVLLTKLKIWQRRYPDDLEQNLAKRCSVLITRPPALTIDWLPSWRHRVLKGVELCAEVRCIQSVAGDGGPLLRCSRCKSTVYCCREHQKAHWPTHKAYCFKTEQ